MKLQDLKNLQLKDKIITFDIVNHKRIPNRVLVNGAIFGNISITTINSFNKWKNQLG